MNTKHDIKKAITAIRICARFSTQQANRCNARLKLLTASGETGTAEHSALLEEQLNIKFKKVALGQSFLDLVPAIDKFLSFAELANCINANLADVNEATHASTPSRLLTVESLENSASVRGLDFVDLDLQPLCWCVILAMQHKLFTDSRYQGVMNSALSEVFGSAFDRFKDQPMKEFSILQRVGVR